MVCALRGLVSPFWFALRKLRGVVVEEVALGFVSVFLWSQIDLR